MHRCLYIHEVLENIVSLSEGGLPNLGLACRAFYEPAMDLLWRDMNGIEPLVRCLPEAVLSVKDNLLASTFHTKVPSRSFFDVHWNSR